jgi:hypothetical protein
MWMFRKNKEGNVINVSLDRKANTPRLFSTNLENIHSKKRLAIFPSPAGMQLAKLSLAGIINVFPARENLVSDIPAGDRKSLTFFYSVYAVYFFLRWKI